jgi:hypothetical protein
MGKHYHEEQGMHDMPALSSLPCSRTSMAFDLAVNGTVTGKEKGTSMRPRN